MHEVSIITSLVDAIIERLKDYDVKKVNSVTITIGDLTNLGEEQMKFAYDVVTRDTILRHSELIIEHKPIELKCDSCGFMGPAKILIDPDYDMHAVPILACPKCNGSVVVTKGQECAVKYIDIEEV